MDIFKFFSIDSEYIDVDNWGIECNTDKLYAYIVGVGGVNVDTLEFSISFNIKIVMAIWDVF